MSFVNPTIYREYDIRGLADKDFSVDFAEILGRAVGTKLHEQGEKQIAVGRDCRLTSEKYAKALIGGLRSSGIHVISLGVCPTPLVYFSVFHEEFHNGISVTGSHNPGEYNGFKICIQKKSLYGKSILALKDRIEKKNFHQASLKGELSSFDIVRSYDDYLTTHIKLDRPLKCIVDAGNGTAGPIAPAIFKKLGCQVEELFCTLDGRFPNHFPDPTVESNLRVLIEKMTSSQVDVGLAFDGDADRIGVVDNTGTVLWGDEIMILFARDILKTSPGAAIIGEVKCSDKLFSDIKSHGGRPIMWKTGHSLIKSKLSEEKALLAGEMSGHIFFADRYYGYDDAIYAACRLLEILSKTKKPLSDLLSDVPKTFATPEIRRDCPDEEKFNIVRKAQKLFKFDYDTVDIDGVRIQFPDGWALIRASNTQPALVLRFEATSQTRLNEIQTLVEAKLNAL